MQCHLLFRPSSYTRPDAFGQSEGWSAREEKIRFPKLKKKSLTVAKLFQLFQHIDVTQSNVPACLHQRALTEEGQGLSESRKNKTLEGNSYREIVKQTTLGLS